MVDIVDIALDRLTDFTAFEKLACEVLRDEGYPDIKPLGGMHDSGRDAILERFYSNESRRSTVVFQITTQETIESKLSETIKKLDEADIRYNQLTLISSHSLSASRQDALKRRARESDVHLEVFDRNTLSNRLSNFDNGIFARYFPDIQSQVKALMEGSSEEELTPSISVRAALSFTASVESDRARERVLSELVLALLLEGKGEGASPAELVDRHGAELPEAIPLQESQVLGVLRNLAANGLVETEQEGKYKPSELGIQRAAASSVDWETTGQRIRADVADMVANSVDAEIDENTRGRIERNAGEAIGLIFRLMGLEVSSQLLGRKEARAAQIGSHEAIVEAARRDLPKDLGAVVVAALAEIIARPNDEQADALSAYACGYVGASLLEVDPSVREFQVTRMGVKIFILDTDFLIDCVVSDNPNHNASLGIIKAIVSCGARVVVPDQCIAEAAKHAEIAENAVRYFGDAIFGLSPVQAQYQIHNAFALGWYFRSLTRRTPFERYIENYYEASNPAGFMATVVKSILPPEIEIGETAALLGVDVNEELAGRLAEELGNLIRSSRKSQYRTDSQVKDLATNDARLYASALSYANKTGPTTKRALGGSCYLVTSSLKFIRAAEAVLDGPDEISARPNAIAALFRLISPTSVSAKDFVALFDNPLLQHATMQCRDDVHQLLEAGLSTRGKLLPRLIFDLDTALHDKLAAVREREQRAEENLLDEDEEARLASSYVNLVKEATGRGYSAIPSAQELIDQVAALQFDKSRLGAEIDDLTQRLENVDSAIKIFGRRKKRYIKRLAAGAPSRHRER